MQWYAVVAAPEDPAAFVTDPSFWLNAGALGVIAGLFILGHLHSEKELQRVDRANAAAMDEMRRLHDAALVEMRRQHDAAMRAQKEAHDAAMQRMDDHVRQLIIERDKANAERNEAVAVMRDFTLMAGAVLNQRPPWGDNPAAPIGGGR